jgi:hypothetical protein
MYNFVISLFRGYPPEIPVMHGQWFIQNCYTRYRTIQDAVETHSRKPLIHRGPSLVG